MSDPRTTPIPAKPPIWFLLMLAAYAVLELSFNHHLLQTSAGVVPDVVALRDLEFWARVISGLGLSLWLMRGLLRRGLRPLLAIALSVLIGITLMWHLQRWLVEGIVERASEQDKQMSLYAQQLSPALLEGQVQVRGQRLLESEPLSPPAQQVWQALLPAISLGLQPQDLQVPQVQSWIGAAALSPQSLTDAYRRAVMVPIALAVSLMFGLANFCLLMSLLLQRLAPGGGQWSRGGQRALWLLLWTASLALSWLAQADEVHSPTYREVTRPALRTAQPLLAPFVEWSLRAQPTWQGPTRHLHETLLGGYGFRRPTWLAGIDL